MADAMRLDAMADPVALAAQRIAERDFDQGVRISGLGGEIARGFYYVGRVRDRAYTRKDAEQFASWRMFVNEAVEPGLLTDDSAAWARDCANAQVYDGAGARAATSGSAPPMSCMSGHRMQRWAGATDTAVSDQRSSSIRCSTPASWISPRDCDPGTRPDLASSARCRWSSTPSWARSPLDGRPAPAVYAEPRGGGSRRWTRSHRAGGWRARLPSGSTRQPSTRRRRSHGREGRGVSGGRNRATASLGALGFVRERLGRRGARRSASNRARVRSPS